MSLFQLRQTSALTRVAKTSFVLLILWVFSSLSACDDSTAPIKEREILVEVPGGDDHVDDFQLHLFQLFLKVV